MKGISKELPWPGARCGWVEYYNRDKDFDFDRFCATIDNAKMIEVCSTKLPQLAITKILSDPRFKIYRDETNTNIGNRSRLISKILREVPEVTFNDTNGAFYNTIIFRSGILTNNQKLKISNENYKRLVEQWVEEDIPLDKRFVYYLLAAKGICVVPISSFCSELQGFRVTLLEEDEETLIRIFETIRDGITEYVRSEPKMTGC
jgi:aspartate/methionine/tyrosine aminotransferase